jgi:hypothetical protein
MAIHGSNGSFPKRCGRIYSQNITMTNAPLNKEKALEVLEKTDFVARFNSLAHGFETQKICFHKRLLREVV